MKKTRGSFRSLLLFVLAVALASVVSGCAPEIGGRASFPLLARTASLPGYEKVAEVNEKRCTHVVLFLVAWGEDANHEALVTDVLAKYKGDAIVAANLTFFSIPAVFYNQQCARVQGTVVRRSASAGQPAAAAPAAPPAVTPATPAPAVTQ